MQPEEPGMWIKVCGIANRETAQAVAGLGPDAIGLNFYPRSPRCLSVDEAEQIVALLPETVEPIGLFVNESAERIDAICRQCSITTVQLHGDEPEELLAEVLECNADYRLVRAFRVGEEGLSPLAESLDRLWRLKVMLHAVLLDARVAGLFGGTGETAPWSGIAEQYREDDWPPLILAGGLTRDNVAEAVRSVRPWGVDVAGGVESSPGVKDLELVREFIAAARAAETQAIDSN